MNEMVARKRYEAIVFGDDPANQKILKRFLAYLLQFLAEDTDRERDTFGYIFLFKIPEEVRGDLESWECEAPLDYLWMCRLVYKARFMGNPRYMINPDKAKPFLETDAVIKFEYDPEIFSHADVEEFEKRHQVRRQKEQSLYAGGVKHGSRKYWDRYWKANPGLIND